MALHITNTDNVTDDATLNLDAATDVTTAVVAGTTYLFVPGAADDGVSVFAVAADGTLTNVDNVTDDADAGTRAARRRDDARWSAAPPICSWRDTSTTG